MGRRLKPSQIKELVKKPGIRAHRNSLRYKMHVKRGDTVQVISGDDKGRVGEVMMTLPDRNMVVVDGVNIIKRHRKSQREGESGFIDEREAPIHVSNVMLYSKKSQVASRVSFKINEDGRKVRVLQKTGEELD